VTAANPEEEDLALEEMMSEEPRAEKEAVAEKTATAADDAGAEEVPMVEEVASEEPPAKKELIAEKAPAAKKTVSKTTATELGVGLSDGERDDLQKLIKGLKKEQPDSSPGAALEEIQKQIRSMSKRLAQLGAMLLKHDAKMKSFYKIIHLYYQKNEAVNKRMDAIMESIKGEEKA
jgi:hypothetical protein